MMGVLNSEGNIMHNIGWKTVRLSKSRRITSSVVCDLINDSHVSVCQVLKVVSSDALVRVGCKDGSAIAQTPQALYPNSLP